MLLFNFFVGSRLINLRALHVGAAVAAEVGVAVQIGVVVAVAVEAKV